MSINSQTRTIEGRILDEHLTPLSGVKISTIDSEQLYKSDKNGYYTIELDNSVKKIKVSYVGMEAETISLNDENCVFNIILLDDITVEFETREEHLQRYLDRTKGVQKLFEKAVEERLFSEKTKCD
ncbi:carboxypeptidase-like protein [Nonlabens dokdonensis]|jgi:hypothetical protein|nr:carboxypeptidase-like regulatory domain-containing protein [Nonlabens dokdonensis]PZX44027.1 carboxypeptidase-like protein [Nonlabens dokdonensis]